jgi:hypothetical protein
MSVTCLLNAITRDTEGVEACLRMIGTRDPPAQMTIQIAIHGSANVRIQGRIAREAPWQDIGSHSASALLHIGAVQFLRAVATDVAANTKVSVWAAWAW